MRLKERMAQGSDVDKRTRAVQLNLPRQPGEMRMDMSDCAWVSSSPSLIAHPVRWNRAGNSRLNFWPSHPTGTLFLSDAVSVRSHILYPVYEAV